MVSLLYVYYSFILYTKRSLFPWSSKSFIFECLMSSGFLRAPYLQAYITSQYWTKISLYSYRQLLKFDMEVFSVCRMSVWQYLQLMAWRGQNLRIQRRFTLVYTLTPLRYFMSALPVLTLWTLCMSSDTAMSVHNFITNPVLPFLLTPSHFSSLTAELCDLPTDICFFSFNRFMCPKPWYKFLSYYTSFTTLIARSV
jgi:hypothetical protein